MKVRLVPLLAGVSALCAASVWVLLGPQRKVVTIERAQPPPDRPPDVRVVEIPQIQPVPQSRQLPRTPQSPQNPQTRELSISMPVVGIDPAALRRDFADARGARVHQALDIMAPRGTAVVAAHDGFVRKLFTSVPGGLTVYVFDEEQRYCSYYAHLDGYAPGLHEGQKVRAGDLLGVVGTTGNAPKDAPHLHFAVTRLDPDRKWWTGTPMDPFDLLTALRGPG